MPKVLRIINRLNLGGPTYNVAYLSKYLAPEYETLLVAGMKDESEASSEFIVNNMGLKPIYIRDMHRNINLLNDYIAYKQIKKLIKDYKPDIVHTHAAKAGAIGRLAAHHCKVPVIIHTFHGHVFHSYFRNQLKTKIFIALERMLAGISSKIIAVSNKQKEELASTYRICQENKIEVVPLGFDLSRFQADQKEKRLSFRKKYNLDENEIAIGIIGRIVPIKNHSLFLKAFKQLRTSTKKKLRAFIVGDGEDRSKIESLAQELDISYTTATDNEVAKKKPLTFTSWIKEVDWVIAGLDIITLTSKNEGTPVSLIEAQAANKPIVTTKVGGIEDIIIPNVTALLSENDSVDSFSNNILKLVEDVSLRQQMSQNGWNHVKDNFDYLQLVRKTKELYDNLLR